MACLSICSVLATIDDNPLLLLSMNAGAKELGGESTLSPKNTQREMKRGRNMHKKRLHENLEELQEPSLYEPVLVYLPWFHNPHGQKSVNRQSPS